jgi:hypothetical protein
MLTLYTIRSQQITAFNYRIRLIFSNPIALRKRFVNLFIMGINLCVPSVWVRQLAKISQIFPCYLTSHIPANNTQLSTLAYDSRSCTYLEYIFRLAYTTC